MPESAIHDWFLEAASNDQTPPVSAPENGTFGTQYPSILREHMAAMRARDEASVGELQATFSVLEEWSLTIPEPIDDVFEGLRVAFQVPAATAQVAVYVTLSVNGSDPYPLRYPGGGWPTPGSFSAGEVIEAIYADSEWQVLSEVGDVAPRVNVFDGDVKTVSGTRTFDRFDPGGLLYFVTAGTQIVRFPETTDPWWPVGVPITLYFGPGFVFQIVVPFDEGESEVTVVNTSSGIGQVIEIWKRGSYQYDLYPI